MKRPRSAALVVALLPAQLPVPSQAADPISKSEIRSDPPAATSRHLRDLIWEMFEHPDLRREKPPRYALADISLVTKKRGTHVPGLCRYDGVWFEFTPLNRDSSADAPTKPIGLTSQSYFGFLVPPTAGYFSLADRARRPGQEKCDKTNDVNFFAADNEGVATDGYYVLLMLQKAIREKTDFSIKCDLLPNSEECRALILSFGPHIGSIQSCDAPDEEGLCFLIDLTDYRLEIFVTGSFSDGPGDQIVSAELHEQIVMTHERID